MKLPALMCNLVMLLVLTGCGGSPTQEPIDLPPPQPLTVEEWKALPVDQKYENDSFERLKLGDEKLRDEQAWAEFMQKVVVPERDKDIPNTGSKQ